VFSMVLGLALYVGLIFLVNATRGVVKRQT
jgi:hypothetical protein